MTEHHHKTCSCGHDHHHHHEGCGCGHDHHHEHHDIHHEIITIIITAILLAAGLLFEHLPIQWQGAEVASLIIFLAAYILQGWSILKHACTSLLKGRVFDENFLMGIATLAAIAIGDFAEAVAVMFFYRFGELFEHIAVEKSRSQIMEAVDLRPETVCLIEGEDVHTIPASDAKVGDILLVRVGDRIPLDAVIVEGESRIDTSPITGEPVPVKVTIGDKVVSGCINTSGVLTVRVEQILENSMVTRILNSVEQAASGKPKIDRFITRFARVYTPFVVALAVLTAIVPSLFTGEWQKWIYTAISFLVISCPCALVISVPLAFFSGIGTGSKKNILFKGGVALESLHQIKAVILDKTGTVTKGKFEVQKCVPIGDVNETELLEAAVTCECQSTHPIGISILQEAKRRECQIIKPEQMEEIPGKGIRAILGDIEILCGNQALLEMYNVDTNPQENTDYGTEVLVAVNGNMIGHIVICDCIKEGAKESISQIKSRGMKTIMLTGDALLTAEAVAKETGIEIVCAKLLPDEKLERLQAIRKKYGKVLFVGDGLNDAPVLAGADVGAAMGNGVDAAIEAADVVFMTSSMQAIPEAFQIAEQTNRIAIQNVIFALGVKALVMILGLFGAANMWFAVFADTGVAMLCVLNSIRILHRK